MSELNTFLVSDSRYSDVTDKLAVAVKDGPASVIPQKYIRFFLSWRGNDGRSVLS